MAPGLGSASPVAAQAPNARGAIEFRESFGLDSDQAHLDHLVASRTSVERWGVPLSVAEEEDLDERVRIQESLTPLADWAEANPDATGGVWLDQTASRGSGVVVRVGVLPGKEAARDAVLVLAPPGIAIEFTPAAFSLADLAKAEEAVLASWAEMLDSGVDLTGTRLDTARNTLEVTIRSGDGDLLRRLHPAISVGDDPGFVPAACSPQERCTLLPFRGGLLFLDYSTIYGQNGCSSGFWTKLSGAYYIVTASHCWHMSGATRVYRGETAPNNPFGTWTQDAIPGPGMGCNGVWCDANVDAAYFKVDTTPGLIPASSRNGIYRDAGNKLYPMTGVRSYASIMNNEAVCKAGISTGLTCGKVTGKGMVRTGFENWPRYGQDVIVHRAIYTDVNANFGDSGGPLFSGGSGHLAYGLSHTLSGGGTDSTYSAVGYALQDMGLTLCITTAC